MGFIVILILTTLAIAGSAAFFSVLGLAHVFSGAYWSVAFMGGSLEAGKLVAASFLYRYWDKISTAMRMYLFAAVISLMGITSMGIFGYLSNAFQDNVLPYQQQQQQIQLLTDENTQIEKLKAERLERSQQINAQIANLPSDYVNGRRRLIAANKDELSQIQKDVASYTEQIRTNTTKLSTLKAEVLQQTSHVGPIIFIAEAFGADVTQATKWLIILIIIVFDPLAVVLTVGANLAIADYKSKKTVAPVEPPPVIDEPKDEPVVVEPIAAEPETIQPEPEPEYVPEPEVEEDVISDVEITPMNSAFGSEKSAFQLAHDRFNKPNLTHQEELARSNLEAAIRNYSNMIGPKD